MSKVASFIAVLLVSAVNIQAQETNPSPNVVVWGDDTLTNVPIDLTNAVSIAGGSGFALAVKSDGTVEEWGPEAANYLGDVPAITNAISVVAGEEYAVVLKMDGTVTMLDAQTNGIYGSIAAQLAATVSTWTNIVGISVSPSQAYQATVAALCVDGSIQVIGAPSPPSDVTNVLAVAAGDGFVMALKSTRKIEVWGNNTYGVLNASGLVTNAGIWSAVAAGGTHCLAAPTNRDTLRAWGDNSSGQTNVPAELTGHYDVAAIAASQGSSMALLTNGSVVCWGELPNPPTNMSTAEAIFCSETVGFAIVTPKVFVPPPPPTVLLQPLSQTVALGATATLLVGATGIGPLTYQWLNGTNAIAGATNRSLVITNFGPADIGQYSVVVANAGGSVMSQPAAINGQPALNINMIPGILITGLVGMNYEVQYIPAFGPTTNAWITLDTVTLTNSPQYYFDVSAVGQPQRFYRLEQGQSD